MLNLAQRLSLRCFDNGGRTFDRYSIVFPDGDVLIVGPTGNDPLGVCTWITPSMPEPNWQEREVQIDYDQLPAPVKQAVEEEYQMFYGEPSSC